MLFDSLVQVENEIICKADFSNFFAWELQTTRSRLDFPYSLFKVDFINLPLIFILLPTLYIPLFSSKNCPKFQIVIRLLTSNMLRNRIRERMRCKPEVECNRVCELGRFFLLSSNDFSLTSEFQGQIITLVSKKTDRQKPFWFWTKGGSPLKWKAKASKSVKKSFPPASFHVTCHPDPCFKETSPCSRRSIK